jgi:hypothetical protein
MCEIAPIIARCREGPFGISEQSGTGSRMIRAPASHSPSSTADARPAAEQYRAGASQAGQMIEGRCASCNLACGRVGRRQLDGAQLRNQVRQFFGRQLDADTSWSEINSLLEQLQMGLFGVEPPAGQILSTNSSKAGAGVLIGASAPPPQSSSLCRRGCALYCL